MKPKSIILLSLGLAIVLCLVLLSRKESTPDSQPNQPNALPSSPATPHPSQSHLSEAKQLCSNLAQSSDPQSAQKLLTELRQTLEQLSPEEAATFVEDYLATGDDAELPLTFEVEKDGQLKSAASLRTALLDHLGKINPEAAAQLSREILSTPTTADEWALALRNVARVEEDSRDFLREKTEALIQNPDWQQNPSAGYLNAFDTLVHIGATESSPLLSELVQNKDRKDLAHASFITLDRLTQNQTEAMLPLLAADTTLHQARPEMTAQQMARADVRSNEQRSILQSWLLAPERTATELQSFAATFPNGNMMVSNNLLTTQTAFDGNDLRDRDLRSLEVVDTWARMQEFEPVQDYLTTMVQRLTNFVKQTESQ
ncbi:MAG: hypothetical protein ACSHYB_17855 [Roseibacillus sp.]